MSELPHLKTTYPLILLNGELPYLKAEALEACLVCNMSPHVRA